MSSTPTSRATVRFGALVTGAASANVRYISQFSPGSVIPVAGDELVIAFGDSGLAASGLGTLAGTTARRIVIPVGEVILGPSTEMIIHTWYPSNATTPASHEVEICWEESRK